MRSSSFAAAPEIATFERATLLERPPELEEATASEEHRDFSNYPENKVSLGFPCRYNAPRNRPPARDARREPNSEAVGRSGSRGC
jgi:hypothetical protein